MSEQKSSPAPARNRSLIAKSNARLAAAQMLYQAMVSGEKIDPDSLLTLYARYVEENNEDPKEALLPAVAADKPLLKRLLTGVCAHDAALTQQVIANLHGNWKLERMGPLMIAILKLALYELDQERKLSEAVIIDEYVTLAHRFVNEEEAGFVQAMLKAAAVELRN